MVDSWYCLDRFVPEGMSQVSRRSEVGNHKRSSLSTRLSSGTSAGTFACPAGPYRKCWGEAGTKNESNRCFVPDRENGPKIDFRRIDFRKIDHHVSNLRTRGFFFKGFRSTLKQRADFWEIPVVDFEAAGWLLRNSSSDFRMSRGALQKMLRRSRYEKRTEQIFCSRSEKWSENRSSRFEPKIVLISFSRGSGLPLTQTINN